MLLTKQKRRKAAILGWATRRHNDFPSITKNNLDAWNSLTYNWIIKGMCLQNPDLKYGEAMSRANRLTNILFKALKKDFRSR